MVAGSFVTMLRIRHVPDRKFGSKIVINMTSFSKLVFMKVAMARLSKPQAEVPNRKYLIVGCHGRVDIASSSKS